MHRTLTSKRQDDDAAENDDANDQEDLVEGNAEDEQSVEAFNANLKLFWKQQEQAKQKAEELKRLRERERLEMASNSMDDLFTEAGRVMQRKLNKDQDGDSDNEDEADKEEEDESLAMKTDQNGGMDKKKEAEEIQEKKKKKEKAILDPDKFIQTVDLTKKSLREVTGDSDDEEEDFRSQAQAISEAFAGDDVTTEFK